MKLLKLLLLTLLWTPTGGQDPPTGAQDPPTEVVCVAMETCLLPCRFTPREALREIHIEWLKTDEGFTEVHSYKDRRDQLDQQDVAFRGRTSLFPELFSGGNASLLLSSVTPQDQGQYDCQVFMESTTIEKLTLRVEAPVVAVNLSLRGDVLVCSSEKIYPQPSLSWSPASEARTEVEEAENGLYSIRSSITVDLKSPKQFTCNISTPSSLKSATYSLQPNESDPSAAVIAVSVLVVIASIIAIAIVLVLWRRGVFRKRQTEPQNEGPEEQQLVARLNGGADPAHILQNIFKDLSENEQDAFRDLLPGREQNQRDISEAMVRVYGDLSVPVTRTVLQQMDRNDLLEELPPPQWNNGPGELEEFDLRKHCPTERALLKLLPLVKDYNKVILSSCGLRESSCGPHGPLASVLSSSRLTLLDLSNNDLQDSGVELLCKGVNSDLCRLQTLSLSGCGLTALSCGPLASVLSSSRLTLLDLSNNDLQDSVVEQLHEGLKSDSCRLQTLSLSLCGLSAASCALLASVLSSSSRLTQLDLSNNDLEDSGVEELCEGLKSAPCRLQTLRLSGCMVTERGGASLAAALSSAPSSLTELDLSYNHPGSSRDLLTALQAPQGPLQTLRVDPAGEQFMVSGLRKYACEISLDPNTAHKRLLVDEDNRTVTNVKTDEKQPSHEDGFTDTEQVLSSSGLRGRCYWEVDWSGVCGNSIAVSYRGIGRKGEGADCRFGDNDQSWSLAISDGEYITNHNQQRAAVSGRGGGSAGAEGGSSGAEGGSSGEEGGSSGRVGVYLDWEGGALSFYEVSEDKNLHHLRTFSCSFTEELFPGFRLGSPDSSVTVVPLWELRTKREPSHE